MRGLVSYLLGGIFVVVAMDFVAPPAGLGISATWPSAEQSTVEQSTVIVDRSHKGDRLVPASVSGAPSAVTHSAPPQIMVGCDPVFSPLSVSARLNYSRRCVA
jgi:hypothetical protein